MTLKAVSSFFICLLSIHASAVTPPEKKPLPIHYSGRVHIDKMSTNETHYTYVWQGVYFEAAFTGPEVDIKLTDEYNTFNIIVDNEKPIILIKPGKVTYSLNNLGEGKHTVRVEKRTENQQDKGVFEGFYIPANQQALPIAARSRTMEFIGDSFTVGYGIESPNRECTPDEVVQTTNTQVAFGPLTAKHFNADYQVNALSGLGVVRNYNGELSDTSLIKQYPYTFNDGGAIYNDAWSPDIIVIGLGGNDFASPLRAHEKWQTREALRADYVKTYHDFIATLRKKNPHAFFILMASDGFQGEIADHVNKVVSSVKNSGDKNIDALIFSGLALSGCHWHPSVKDNQRVAQLLIDYIAQRPALWGK